MNDIITALKAKAATDPQLRAVLNRVKKGTADFKDTAAYSTRFAHLLGKTLSDNVLEIPTDVRETIATELLRYGYDDLNTVLAEVQTSLDAAAGIHIRPQQAAFPAERVQQYVHSLVDPTVDDKTIRRRARSGSDTITKSFHDDYIKKNAQFRHDAGLKCYIIREGSNCCEWCCSVVGKYRFGEQPDDIFRRHDNCDCTVIYDGQVLRGKQNADGSRSKTWEEIPNADSSYNPAVLSPEEAERLQAKNKPIILTSNDNNAIMGKKNSETAESDVHKLGKIDVEKYKEIASGDILTDEVIITDNRIDHIIKRRGKLFYDDFSGYFSEIVADPDYIFKDEDFVNTAIVSKSYKNKGKTVNLILKLVVEGDNPNYKNSILSAIGEGKSRFEQRLRNHEPVYKKVDK